MNVLMQFEKWNFSRPCYEKGVNMIINSVDIFLISHTMNWLLNVIIVIMTSFSMSHSYHESHSAMCELLMLVVFSNIKEAWTSSFFGNIQIVET